MTWLASVAKALLGASAKNDPATVIATVGSRKLTWGDADAAANAVRAGAIGNLERAIIAIASQRGTAADYELVGEDVLQIVAYDPALAAPATVAAALLPFIVEGIASGQIRGDPWPERDANAYQGRGGRGN